MNEKVAPKCQWHCQYAEVGGKVEGVWGTEVPSGVQRLSSLFSKIFNGLLSGWT